MSGLERARVQRPLIAAVQVLALATWLSASAVVPTLQAQWQISLTAAVWVTASTQLGFVIGAVASAVGNLADRVRPHLLLAVSAVGAAVCTLAFAGFANSLALAIPLRLATGVFLAGVYPVGLKLMASWTPPERRGQGMGLLIGALTLGSALPHIIGTLEMDWRVLLAIAAATTLLGALVCAGFIRPGPHLSRSSFTPNPRYVIEMFRDRRQRLVNFGYLGHMWELYALWAWLPLFATVATRTEAIPAGGLSLAAFVTIGLAGVAGALIGGWTADRWGRRSTAAVALAVSGACCLFSPLAFVAPPVVLLVFAALWGASVIADSGVFSAMLSSVVKGSHAGTALTAQTAAGFLLTVVSIQFVPLAAQAVGWQYALMILAIGPVFGVAAMLRYPRSETPSSQAQPEERPGRQAGVEPATDTGHGGTPG